MWQPVRYLPGCDDVLIDPHIDYVYRNVLDLSTELLVSQTTARCRCRCPLEACFIRYVLYGDVLLCCSKYCVRIMRCVQVFFFYFKPNGTLLSGIHNKRTIRRDYTGYS